MDSQVRNSLELWLKQASTGEIVDLMGMIAVELKRRGARVIYFVGHLEPEEEELRKGGRVFP